MARIPLVTARDASLSVKLVYFFTQRSMARLARRKTARMLEPVEVYAHVPGLLRGYARLEQATAALRLLDHRSRALAELKTATVAECSYCIDLGSQVARGWGLTDAELLALPDYRTSKLFDERDKLVLDYAVAMTRTPAEVPAELVADLQRHYTDPQLVELTHVIALENHRSRFNLAFGISATGFSEGKVCALPASTSAAADPSPDTLGAPGTASSPASTPTAAASENRT